jgi:hypothetical protein
VTYISPHSSSNDWCSRALKVTQVYPGITMHLVPVKNHPDERAWETSLTSTRANALHDWTINWAENHPRIEISWDKSPFALPGSHWVTPTLDALLRTFSGRYPVTTHKMCMLNPRLEHLSDASLYKVLGPAKELTLWVNHPTTDLPQLYANESFTIPAAIDLLATAHLISYPRGLYFVPARTSMEPEPWIDHPIMQALHNRVKVQWRTLRETKIDMTPLPQPRKVTRAQTNASTQWLLMPLEAVLGPLELCYTPSPIATFALLSSWQSHLRTLHPDNIRGWIAQWLQTYPSLHIITTCIPQPPPDSGPWSEWLTQLVHTRFLRRQDDQPSAPSSVQKISEFLSPRMNLSNETTRRLLRDYLEDLLQSTPTHTTQTPPRETLHATLLALADDTSPTRPPRLPLHHRRALLPQLPIWHWTQSPKGARLQSICALETAPFTPEQIMKLGPALVSPQTAHELYLKQPTQCTTPLISTMPVVGMEALADAIGKIINDLAKRFFNSYARNELMLSSSNNNSSSIAPVGHSTAPPRKHATRKKHKHDKRDP